MRHGDPTLRQSLLPADSRRYGSSRELGYASLEEIESRIDAFDAGKLFADDEEAVFKRINQR